MTPIYRHVRRALFVVFACTVFYPAVFAQTHDKPGYYINAGGDTIRGLFIGFKETTMTPVEFAFQPTNGSPIHLHSTDCRVSFIAHSGVYIAYQGKRLTNTTDYHNATTDTADVFEDISAFLHEIYNDGKYRLYQYNNGKRSNFYVANGNGPLQELYYKEIQNNGEAVESQTFRLQLTALFLSELQSHPQRQMEINAVTYDTWHLTRLFASMTGDANKTVHSDEKYPLEVYVGGGIANSALNVTVGSVYGIGGFPDWADR